VAGSDQGPSQSAYGLGGTIGGVGGGGGVGGVTGGVIDGGPGGVKDGPGGVMGGPGGVKDGPGVNDGPGENDPGPLPANAMATKQRAKPATKSDLMDFMLKIFRTLRAAVNGFYGYSSRDSNFKTPPDISFAFKPSPTRAFPEENRQIDKPQPPTIMSCLVTVHGHPPEL
jgi:hypothetical protein